VTVRLMSDGELARLELLRDFDRRRLTVETTAQLLGLERRPGVPAAGLVFRPNHMIHRRGGVG
jgi:hypothetical protein